MEKEPEEEGREAIPGEYGYPIPKELFLRELGFAGFSGARRRSGAPGSKLISRGLQTKAVHTLCTKELDKRKFKLPAGARTTFHIAFSPDGTKVASCHGDHNVYICCVSSGNVLQTLTGHPRTPWCVVFHPSQNDILASGCLAGHVRVWDLKAGSELLVTDSGTVIASLAFHPSVRLLAIATFNEIIFWDWAHPYPMARTSTENTKEKVRLVRFDKLGRSLITGITNFPSPPPREEPRRTTSNTRGTIFRPNILSRSASGGVSREPGADLEEEDVDMETLAATAAAALAEDPQLIGEAGSQDRFQESYRQLVTHYEELVSNYQQFLQSRIPRILDPPPQEESGEVVINQIDSFHEAAMESVQPEVEVVSSTTTLESPASPVPGPSRLIFENNPPESPSSSDSQPGTSSGGGGVSNGSEPRRIPTERSDTDFQSIEALAQNIIEMQNLCSQVRMDAPLAVENQHIMELRVIRRHLELLQEQTRELQSSIRATLNSLATGSLAALRSHMQQQNAAAAASTPPNDPPFMEQATPPTPIGAGPGMDFDGGSPHHLSTSPPLSPTRSSRGSGLAFHHRRGGNLPSSGRVIPNNPNPNAQGPNTLYRIMIATPFTESNRLPNTPLFNRIRVPPMVAMQYEMQSGGSSTTSTSREEPIPGPSRASSSAPRRIVREFHLVSGRPGASFVAEEHSRHCPFSGRDPYHWRPPPRMRSLYDMGEMPYLVEWPTFDTGLAGETRNFREITPQRPSTSGVSSQTRSPMITITVRNDSSSSSVTRPPPVMTFNQWQAMSGLNSGQSLTSDVLVSVYLSIRQLTSESRSESWQESFGHSVPGLAFIPPQLRQGQRVYPPGNPSASSSSTTPRCTHRRRRAHWITFGGSGSSSGGSSSGGGSSARTCPGPHSSRAPPPSSSSTTPLPDSSSEQRPSTSSSSCSSSNPSSSSKEPPKLGRIIPATLDENFTRVFYIRSGEELIPVYSTVNPEQQSPIIANEVRESLQNSVYYLPIGLFLQGGPWESSTTIIAIHWPPTTREEEYAVLDLRMSDRPLAVHSSAERTSYPTNRSYPRVRVDYDQTSLRVTLPTGFRLTFIQSGLTLLDCISSSGSLPRPRPLEGTVWVDFFGQFLDALERSFGLRNVRRGISGGSGGHSHRVGAFFGRGTPPWVHTAGRPSQVSPAEGRASGGVGGGSSSRGGGGPMSSGSSRREYGERLRSMSRRVITLGPDVAGDHHRRYMEEGGSPVFFRGSGEPPGGDRHFRSLTDRRLYFRRGHRQDGGESGGREEGPGSSRFIRLAVDTAANQVLRRSAGGNNELENGLPVVEAGPQQPGFSSMRPVESRIERVLNERGNRGAHPPPGGMMDEGARNRMRLEEIQMRISMLSQWSRARQGLGGGSGRPMAIRTGGPPGGGGTRPRTFSERGTEGDPSVEEWFARMGGEESRRGSPNERDYRFVRSHAQIGARSRINVGPVGEGSARTRAPPSQDENGADPGPHHHHPRRIRISRRSFAPHFGGGGGGGGLPSAAGSNDGNNNSVGGNGGEDYQGDPGARFYPGYIPEILITPRTRAPTYYTMDAATTAFLSSRIQKWDFTEFFIPDITKREEQLVVRECSLHSDACLDVSSDSKFVAVLQPSDGGSYSSVGIYSLGDDSLGEVLCVYHFDQNTVSVSISPSCDYLVVGYAGRGPLYRFVHPSRGIGKILSLSRDEDTFKLVSVKDLFAEGQVAFMSINCMHWVPVSGYGIVYGTNTGDLVLLS